MDWKTSAAIFPGQGSQTVGMGADFARTYSCVRETFEQADEILGFDLSRICFAGPSEVLNQTNITQPALYVCSIAIWTGPPRASDADGAAFMAGRSQPGRVLGADRRQCAELSKMACG